MIDRNHIQLWLIHGNKLLMNDLIPFIDNLNRNGRT